ncbi:MAG: DMT family transporter [Firmicutes bacterium]|nr:DMT family transporter [Bacillota bacterium]
MEKFLSKYAKILVVLATVLGALSGPLGKAISAPSLAIGFWRLTMGLPFFIIPVFASGYRRNELKDIDTKSLIGAVVAGIFLFIHFYAWFNAVKMTNISSAAVIASLHPLVVVFISIAIYKRKIGIKPIIGIVIALIGAALTAGLDYANLSMTHFTGDMLAVITGLSMGIYYALGDKVRGKVDGAVYVLILFASCWLCFLIAMLASGTSFFDYPSKDWIMLVIMTLACQVGCHALNNLCLGHADSVYVSAWSASEMVFASFFAWLLIGQVPTNWGIIGSIIVIGGLLYYVFNSRGIRGSRGLELDG